MAPHEQPSARGAGLSGARFGGSQAPDFDHWITLFRHAFARRDRRPLAPKKPLAHVAAAEGAARQGDSLGVHLLFTGEGKQ